MDKEQKRRKIALLVLGTGVLMFILMLIFVLPYFMSEKKYGEMQAALNEGNYNKVFQIAEFLLEQNPKSVQAYYFRGQAYLAKKKYTLAEHDLEMALKLNAQYSNMRSVSVQLGEIYHKHGLAVLQSEPDKAFRLFKKALKYLPREIGLKKDFAKASFLVALALEDKDAKKAEEYYRTSLKYDPDEPVYKMSLGRTLSKLKDSEEAVNLMLDALKQDEVLKTPRNLKTLTDELWTLAVLKEQDYFLGQGDKQTVNKYLDYILEFDSENRNVYLEKFAFALNTDDLTEAENILNNIKEKGLILPVQDLEKLLQKGGVANHRILFSDGNLADTELKLDSELAWSGDGNVLIVKGMGKSTSETKVVAYNIAQNTITELHSPDKISWEGKIFTPFDDGVYVLSGNDLYKVDGTYEKIDKVSTFNGNVFDISRDGTVALLGRGNRLTKYNIKSGKQSSVRVQGLRGKINMAAYSPQNKRVAVIAGDDEKQVIGVNLGKGKSKIVAGGMISEVKWSWDGKHVLYLDSQYGINAIYMVPADGSNEASAISKPELNPTWFEPSPVDGYILYKGKVGKEALWLSDEGGSFDAVAPRIGEVGKFVWSPDGTKIAYLFSPVKGGPVRLEMVDISRY